jgi:hypothetical protein
MTKMSQLSITSLTTFHGDRFAVAAKMSPLNLKTQIVKAAKRF